MIATCGAVWAVDGYREFILVNREGLLVEAAAAA